MDALEGGCLCGRIRYRIEAKPERVAICHCRTCRRASGAPSVAWAVVERTSFELEGDPTRYHSSSDVERTHCPACGTSLTYAVSGEATIDVTLASLDDPEQLKPRKEVWLEHRLSWEAPNDELKPFDRDAAEE